MLAAAALGSMITYVRISNYKQSGDETTRRDTRGELGEQTSQNPASQEQASQERTSQGDVSEDWFRAGFRRVGWRGQNKRQPRTSCREEQMGRYTYFPSIFNSYR